MILFLYVCENEGLIVSELADVAGVPLPMAARVSKMLAGALEDFAVKPDSRLLELREGKEDKRLRHIFLTSHGRRVRAHLDEIIKKASPIQVNRPDQAGLPSGQFEVHARDGDRS